VGDLLGILKKVQTSGFLGGDWGEEIFEGNVHSSFMGRGPKGKKKHNQRPRTGLPKKILVKKKSPQAKTPEGKYL